MFTFKYSFFAKLIYRYGNIPITLLLGIQLLFSIIMIDVKWYFLFFALFNLLIIFFLNRFYFRSYKLFPFKIEINNEIMICTDFFNRSKTVEIYLQDIDDIKGGTLTGSPGRPVYIHDGKNNITIGLHSHIGNYNKLLTIILSNVTKELYNQVLDQARELYSNNKLVKSKRDKYKKRKPIK